MQSHAHKPTNTYYISTSQGKTPKKYTGRRGTQPLHSDKNIRKPFINANI
jgi:hypothetical protein